MLRHRTLSRGSVRAGPPRPSRRPAATKPSAVVVGGAAIAARGAALRACRRVPLRDGSRSSRGAERCTHVFTHRGSRGWKSDRARLAPTSGRALLGRTHETAAPWPPSRGAVELPTADATRPIVSSPAGSRKTDRAVGHIPALAHGRSNWRERRRPLGPSPLPLTLLASGVAATRPPSLMRAPRAAALALRPRRVAAASAAARARGAPTPSAVELLAGSAGGAELSGPCGDSQRRLNLALSGRVRRGASVPPAARMLAASPRRVTPRPDRRGAGTTCARASGGGAPRDGPSASAPGAAADASINSSTRRAAVRGASRASSTAFGAILDDQRVVPRPTWRARRGAASWLAAAAARIALAHRSAARPPQLPAHGQVPRSLRAGLSASRSAAAARRRVGARSPRSPRTPPNAPLPRQLGRLHRWRREVARGRTRGSARLSLLRARGDVSAGRPALRGRARPDGARGRPLLPRRRACAGRRAARSLRLRSTAARAGRRRRLVRRPLEPPPSSLPIGGDDSDARHRARARAPRSLHAPRPPPPPLAERERESPHARRERERESRPRDCAHPTSPHDLVDARRRPTTSSPPAV